MKDNGVPSRLARSSQQSISTLLAVIAIASLSVLFLASLLAIVLLGSRPGQPDVTLELDPGGLWVSTILLFLSSAALHGALLAAKGERQLGIRIAMVATLLLGLAFLGNQLVNWRQLLDAGLKFQGAYGGGFFFLTGLHAAHVVGGLIPMAFVAAAAFRGVYTRTAHHGLVLLGIYWHFLAVVWLALLAFLLLR